MDFKILFNIFALAFLGFCVLQARKANEDSISQIEKFGDDQKGKFSFAMRALLNFYLVMAGAFVVSTALLGLISSELFVILFVAVLAGFGVKIVTDIRQ